MKEIFSELNKSVAAEFIAANLDLGMYPKSHKHFPIVYEERTEYMNGWNDAIKAMTEAVSKGLDKFRKDSDLALLVLADVGFFNGDEYLLNMNDTFHYARADCEEVGSEDLGEVARLFKTYGYGGLTYWVSKKRNEKSQIPQVQNSIEEISLLEEKRNILIQERLNKKA